MYRKNTSWPRIKRILEILQWNSVPLLSCGFQHAALGGVMPSFEQSFQVTICKEIHRWYFRRIYQLFSFPNKFDLTTFEPLDRFLRGVTGYRVHVQNYLACVSSKQFWDIHKHHRSKNVLDKKINVDFRIFRDHVQSCRSSVREASSEHALKGEGLFLNCQGGHPAFFFVVFCRVEKIRLPIRVV